MRGSAGGESLLNTSSGAGHYSVVAIPQFRNDWRQAVDDGFIAQEREASLLALLREMLAENPYRHQSFHFDDEPVDMRWFDLYGGRRDPRVEVWYSILEDDRIVHLVAVVVIHSQSRLNLPGFDFQI